MDRRMTTNKVISPIYDENRRLGTTRTMATFDTREQGTTNLVSKVSCGTRGASWTSTPSRDQPIAQQSQSRVSSFAFCSASRDRAWRYARSAIEKVHIRFGSRPGARCRSGRTRTQRCARGQSADPRHAGFDLDPSSPITASHPTADRGKTVPWKPSSRRTSA